LTNKINYGIIYIENNGGGLMERLKNGIYATAMDMRIMKAYEEMDDEDQAEDMLTSWLAYGVPDGNGLDDNINDFGNKEDFDELVQDYMNLCEWHSICPNFSKEVEEIKKNIVEMLDNPYYNVI
jgi:hypothetical protein